MSLSNEVVAVSLGGGAGSRLYPLTASRSKPAVPIAGKYRLVDIPISNCMNSNIQRMFVLTQYNSASLNKHIKNTYHFSAFSKGFVDILAAEQTPDSTAWYQGTADAVRQSLKHIANQEYEYVLILSGDQLYQIDFSEMVYNHKKSEADISIATIPVTSEQATEFGIMKTDENNFITSFIEKPKPELHPAWVSNTGEEMQKAGRNYIASMGIYVFNRYVLKSLLTQEYSAAADFGKEIIPHSLKNYKVSSFQYNGYWTDIGNISSFFDANIALTKDIPSINLYDVNQTIYTRPRMLPPAKIGGTRIDKSVIAEGSIILADKIERSLIGVRSRIGFNTTVVCSYIMGNDFYETLDRIEHERSAGSTPIGIGNDCYIDTAIIDKNVRIGNRVVIKGGKHLENTDQEFYTIKDGIIVVKKGAVLPDGFTVQ
jgi:glucose-1-phosphate adenylyltransferase